MILREILGEVLILSCPKKKTPTLIVGRPNHLPRAKERNRKYITLMAN